MKKNVASQTTGAQMASATDGSAFTGTVTVYVTGDGGTQALGGTASGVCTHEGNGFHSYVPTQAETNYDQIAFTYIGTGAIPATVQVYPTFPQTIDNPTAAAIVNEWETQSQADPTGFHVNVLEVGGIAQTANDNGADINTLLTRIVGTLAAGTHNPATAAQIAVLSDWINGGRLDLILDLILADSNELQTNQGSWLTATGFATEAKQDAQDLIITETRLAELDTANLPADIAAVKADTAAILTDTGTTLPALIDDLAIKKNTAFSNFEFLMVLTSDHATPATGLTVTGQRSIDGGAFASVSGTIAEISNGIYQFDALAADTNGDVITWRFSSATADDAFITFKTVA